MELGNGHLLQKQKCLRSGHLKSLSSSQSPGRVLAACQVTRFIDNSIGPNYIMYANFHLPINVAWTSLSVLIGVSKLLATFCPLREGGREDQSLGVRYQSSSVPRRKESLPGVGPGYMLSEHLLWVCQRRLQTNRTWKVL